MTCVAEHKCEDCMKCREEEQAEVKKALVEEEEDPAEGKNALDQEEEDPKAGLTTWR